MTSEAFRPSETKRNNMSEKDILDYIQLDQLIQKINVQANLIETGDFHYKIAYIEQFPYFIGDELLERRYQALHEYLQMLVLAFVSACKYINNAPDSRALELVDGSIVFLNGVLTRKQVVFHPIPMAKAMYDLYNSTFYGLKRKGYDEYASHLEILRRVLFMSWTPVG
jgi:hypothetical protein